MPSDFEVYHYDAAGSGLVPSVSKVVTSKPAWTSPVLDGDIFGEPLVYGGRVFVATENDTVYALSTSTGKVLWSHHLASPVPAGDLPCSDISPTVGITGTPVIDPARSELFAVADELAGGKASHVLVGINTTSGKTELSQKVDPPGSLPADILQRTGLTLEAGRVVFGYGGNSGDCGSYHGWVVAVPETGGSASRFEVDSPAGDSQGAVWMGGAAPVVDSAGDVLVEAGNGSVKKASAGYDDSDSVLELSPTMKLLQYFAPASWPSDNASDFDMSTAPALVGDQVVAASKSGKVFLLNASDLGGIGGARADLTVCSTVIDGGLAVDGSVVFLPCRAGTAAVRIGPGDSIKKLWGSTNGDSPPIVVAGEVWTMGAGSGTLLGLNPANGDIEQKVSIGKPPSNYVNHFPTPSVADGLFLLASSDQVVAFSAESGTAPAAGAVAATGTSQPRAGGTGSAEVALVVTGAVVLAGLFATTLRRRQVRRHAV